MHMRKTISWRRNLVFSLQRIKQVSVVMNIINTNLYTDEAVLISCEDYLEFQVDFSNLLERIYRPRD
jgi:hypothetical protein